MIYLITPTGSRQKGIDLLASYINAQTYTGKVTWVIVDDCRPITIIPPVRTGVMTITVDPSWVWKEGMNTQSQSMSKALEYVPDDAMCLVMEDDDCYFPGHIENIINGLIHSDLVGERTSRYYNVTTKRYRVIEGKYHASLASVGVKGEALKKLKEICNSGSRRIDMDLWSQYQGNKTLLETANVIGIKGLPGRPGIGVGHRDTFGTPDNAGIFESWLGDYAGNYG